MRSSAALLALSLSLALAQTVKIPPPEGIPALRLNVDFDSVSEYGNETACTLVKSQREICYSTGTASGSTSEYNTCMCADVTAEAMTQCFAYSYPYIKNTTEQALYYQSFLFYLYDCYCITNTDVSLNATTGKPYVGSLNGTLIIPPEKPCPVPDAPVQAAAKPPCGCKPPVPPCPWTRCDPGYKSVNGKCVPDCKVPPTCNYPSKLEGDKCVCKWPNQLDKNGICREPTCPPPLVAGCKGCVCPKGQEFGKDTKSCVPYCPEGTRRSTPGGPCNPYKCPKPAPWATCLDGQCYCPDPYVIVNGDCVPRRVTCPYPYVPDQWNPRRCVCPCPYQEINGVCTPPPPRTTCTPPFIVNPYEPWRCLCPKPYYLDPYTGSCTTVTCTSPLILDPEQGICVCERPYQYNNQGQCVMGPTCQWPKYSDYSVDPAVCSCAYPWTPGSGDTCSCVSPNTLDATGECNPPDLYYADSFVPQILALPEPNGTVSDPSTDDLSASASGYESALPSTDAIPSESAVVSSSYIPPTETSSTETETETVSSTSSDESGPSSTPTDTTTSSTSTDEVTTPTDLPTPELSTPNSPSPSS